MLSDPSLRDRTARRAHLLTLLGLALAALTSAHGPGIVVYVLEHSGGDAVRHIADMRAPSWAELNPISPYALGFWLLGLIALVGVVAARKIWWTGLGLALLGLALLLTAVRFVDAAVILMLPLALRSADILAELPKDWRGWKWLAALLSAGLMGWLLFLARGWWGPLGRTTADESKLPSSAIAWLDAAPPGNVLSTYEADAPIGFFLAGKDRVFVDGRTPLYFDSADYGVARDVWLDARALDLALRRYDVSAVVAPRDGELCRWMASRWPLVAVEPGFATFARAPQRSLTHLSACGDELMTRQACDDYAATSDELGQTPPGVRAILQIDLAAYCRQATTGALPSLRASWPWQTQWRHAAARLARAQSRPQEALDILAPLIDAGDLPALSILRPAFNELPMHEVRKHLDAAVRALDDDAPPELRADLALACSAEGDAECVRFHGLRAAAHGVATAREPLEWLAAHHPSERVRADARAWLLTLPLP
jgi:hypothetical protein